jgi:predicted MFS family arabinose efflux permease
LDSVQAPPARAARKAAAVVSTRITVMNYPAVLRSLPKLLLGNRIVLGMCAAGVVVGAAFGTFWNTLSFVLLHEFGLGPAIVGLFGLVVEASALTSPLAGRLTDRFGPRLGQFTLVGLILLAWVALAVGPGWIGWFVIGTVLLDVGVWGNQVVNQSVLFGLDAAHHNRLNTLYFFTRFLGIAAGSAFGAQLWDVWGWPAVATFGLLASTIALPAAVFAAPKSQRQHAV